MSCVLLLPSPLLPRLAHLPFLLAELRRSVEAVGPDLVLTHSNAGRYAALAALGIPVEGEQRLRMSYVRSVLGAPASWTQQPQAYLAFGETYADEPALARGLG